MFTVSIKELTVQVGAPVCKKVMNSDQFVSLVESIVKNIIDEMADHREAEQTPEGEGHEIPHVEPEHAEQ